MFNALLNQISDLVFYEILIDFNAGFLKVFFHFLITFLKTLKKLYQTP
jgi:hypothetical protein